MASGMVKMATDDKLKETDWAKNIEICELVSTNPGYSFVVRLFSVIISPFIIHATLASEL
jgi:hypothetical protein